MLYMCHVSAVAQTGGSDVAQIHRSGLFRFPVLHVVSAPLATSKLVARQGEAPRALREKRVNYVALSTDPGLLTGNSQIFYNLISIHPMF